MTLLQFGGLISIVIIVAAIAIVFSIPTQAFWVAVLMAAFAMLLVVTVLIFIVDGD